MVRVFASHDWGEGEKNHRRVVEVAKHLRGRGLDVWLDETHMKGNILDAMCAGIDASDHVLVFVTRNYMDKVRSGGETDNVRREFMYAARHPEKLIPIRFEDSLPRVWTGPVGMVLGSYLYTDLCQATSCKMDTLATSLLALKRESKWKKVVLPPKKKDITVKERIQKACLLLGHEDSRPSHETVENLYRSVAGGAVSDLPLIEKLARVERELGLRR